MQRETRPDDGQRAGIDNLGRPNLHGHWRAVAWGIWVLVLLASLVILALGARNNVLQTTRPCSVQGWDGCVPYVEALARLGLAPLSNAVYLVGLMVVAGLLLFVLSGLMIARGPGRPLAVLLALILAALGATANVHNSIAGWASANGPAVLVHTRNIIGALVNTLFFLAFLLPDGRFQPRGLVVPAVI